MAAPSSHQASSDAFPRPITIPHIVVVPWPGQGHINPLLHLSKKLAIHGFSITFVNNEYTHVRLSNSLSEQHQLAEASTKPAINFVCLPDGVASESIRTSNVPELSRGVLRSSGAFEQLLQGLKPPPTCIISDIFVLHTQDAANKLGIPRVGFWTQSAASYAAHCAAARGLIGSVEDKKLMTTIAGAPPDLRFDDLPSFLQNEDPFMFDFCTRPFLRINEAACVLMNTFDDMEGEAMEALREEQPGVTFYTIGPVLPEEYFSGMKLSHSPINKTLTFWKEDERCLRWLDEQEEGSVLYVSFGSIAELSAEEVQELALGLEASEVPLLWVLRPGMMEGDAVPSQEVFEGFKERMNKRLLIVEWAPQLHVLAHSAIGAFLTHAGWNSTLEGVAQGKPMLAFPYFADQLLNSQCIQHYWGIGLAFERHGRGVLTRSLVKTGVHTVMYDHKIRHRALQLCDASRRATHNEKGKSATNLTNFISNLCHQMTSIVAFSNRQA